MSAPLLLGALFGCGVLVIVSGAQPARQPLAVALAQLHRPRPTISPRQDESFFTRIVGMPLARSHIGTLLREHVGADLRIVGIAPEALLARCVTIGLAGLLWAPATVALMTLGGVHITAAIPLWCSAALAAGGVVLPFFAVRIRAAERRRAFRHALGCFLDLVAVRLAGGAGVQGALSDSAASGHGWPFAELRHALARARLDGQPPWAALDQLGRELGIRELNELAASVTLAGDEGARVRASIAAKARAIRIHELTDTEGAAQAASERMSMPIVLLMVGFVVFLGYPAVMQVLTGL